MFSCRCHGTHLSRRIVLTGGPGAGKTAVLELIRQAFCRHIAVLPEAAGIVFGGGFPRAQTPAPMRAAQRAIFHVQRELEAAAEDGHVALLLCDRGTVDGGAYWPGPGDLWTSVGTTLASEVARYDVVIHLMTPRANGGYNYQNPLRTESAERAGAIDAQILELWKAHPRRWVIEPEVDFYMKAGRALQILRDEVPECCRPHFIPMPTAAATAVGGG
jgi:predicted ATPase